RCTEHWGCFASEVRYALPVRESAMKPVGKPDAGNPHVRFDERGWETGRRTTTAPAPILDSTAGVATLRATSTGGRDRRRYKSSSTSKLTCQEAGPTWRGFARM